MGRLGLSVVLLLALTACAAPATAQTTASASSPIASAQAGEEQQHEAGAVTVVGAWLTGTSSVRIALDTHSVDLDGFDLKALARVRLDGGSWVAPTAWDAPKGGHHRSGALTFGSLEPQALAGARLVELEIRDVGAPLHLLRWERAR